MPISLPQLIDQIFEDAKSEKREICPFIRRDSGLPYCGKIADKAGKVNDESRMVTDTASLQLWCLRDYGDCIIYKED